VLQRLTEADDFLSALQLSSDLRQPYNRVHAALWHLRRRHAVEAMEVSGHLYWFATPADDDRSRTVDERCPESKPRKTRKPKKKEKQA
jgi:hypothetical protein